ncbi:hypothetical protein LOK49_Contig422G00001 [Camellia lanceoleosa]|nr:hypothetical protein LOK49_Contig422G00001 [Camellia lanceoleosa]
MGISLRLPRIDYYIKVKRFSLQFVSLLEMRPLKSVVELPPPVMAPPPPESVVEVPPELPMLVVEFCLTAAFEIAIRSNQTPTQYYSITFHLVCLLMVFAFAFIFVAKYISSKLLNPGRVLEHAGVVCGVTAFFVAITVSFALPQAHFLDRICSFITSNFRLQLLNLADYCHCQSGCFYEN